MKKTERDSLLGVTLAAAGGGLLLVVAGLIAFSAFQEPAIGCIVIGVVALLCASQGIPVFISLFKPPRVPVGTTFNFKEVFNDHTPNGFTVGYELTGYIRVTDEPEFLRSFEYDREQDDLSPKGRGTILTWFFYGEFRSFLKRTGFAGYAWPRYQGTIRLVPRAYRHRFCGQENGIRLHKRDRNCRDTVKDSQQVTFEDHGCSVSVILMKVIVGPEHIGENARILTMIYGEECAGLNDDEIYNRTEECAVVAALKREQEIRETMQRIAIEGKWIGPHVEIKSKQFGTSVEITWTFTSKAPQDYVLLGFRREGGFQSDKWQDETANGTLMIQEYHQDNGAAVQQLVEGKEYFYTFVLKGKIKGSSDPHYAFVARFSLRVPTAVERKQLLEDGLRIKELERRLDEVLSRGIGAASATDNVLIEFDRKLMNNVNTVAGVRNLGEKRIAEVKAASLSDADKDDLIGRINEWCDEKIRELERIAL